jgi:hypothetical protein
LLAAALVFVALAASTGCTRVKLADTAVGAGATGEKQTVALGSATALKTSVRMGVGTLQLSAVEPSSTLAMNATFTYPQASWKPKVDYSVDATLGTLSVAQPEVSAPPGITLGTIGEDANTWRLKLAADVPTDLSLKLGVGQSDVDLRQVDLRNLAMITGVGKATVDISGARANDLKAHIEAGVGELDLTVPRDVGVSIVGGKNGVGDLKAEGFSESDGIMRNAAWTGSGPKIMITLVRGVGEVTITQR